MKVGVWVEGGRLRAGGRSRELESQMNRMQRVGFEDEMGASFSTSPDFFQRSTGGVFFRKFWCCTSLFRLKWRVLLLCYSYLITLKFNQF